MTLRRIPEPGELLAERYRVVRLIGEGGMGAVLEAENTLTHKRVAIKLLHPALGQNTEAAQRLVREAQASCRIRHQNVVDVYDVVCAQDALFLIMELLEGEPLSAWLERGGVPAHEFIAIVLSAMRGVAAAHRVGVIHRDIHPGNILLAREPPSALLVPKVLDFGIAKIRDDHQRSLTGSGVTMGTPLYMSYEQLCNARDIDARTDVYPFGVILYQGLTGHQPFSAGALTELLIKLSTETPISPKQLAPEIPTALDRLICWALERDRDKRVPSIDAFIDELEPFSSARAFRTQMTDAQRTLPAIVPRGWVPPPASGRASDSPSAPVSEVTQKEVAANAPPNVSPIASPSPSPSPPSVAPARDTASQAKVLPLVFAAAAALAVIGTGTFVVRRCASPVAADRRAPAPPPLPVPDLALVAPAAHEHAGADRPPTPVPVNHASSARDLDAAAPPFAPEVSLPQPRVARPSAEPWSPAPRRRFRAGEARPIDF